MTSFYVSSKTLLGSRVGIRDLFIQTDVQAACRQTGCLILFVVVVVSASKSVSDAKTVIPMVKQPVFLRSMSAPSDLEMIANQDLEFTHAPQRYLSIFVIIFLIDLMFQNHISELPINLFLYLLFYLGGDTTLLVIAAAHLHCCSLWP